MVLCNLRSVYSVEFSMDVKHRRLHKPNNHDNNNNNNNDDDDDDDDGSSHHNHDDDDVTTANYCANYRANNAGV